MTQSKQRAERRPLFDFGGADKRLVAWAACLNFFLLAAYYILRPVRDEIFSSYTGQRDDLFQYTFFATSLAAIAFAALTRVVSRNRLVTGTFLFLALNLLAFLIQLPAAEAIAESAPWIEKVFYVWVNVFVMVGVSTLWSLLSDSFRSEQAKGAFGLFFFGSTLGMVVASEFVSLSITTLGREGLLTTALALVLGTALCAWRIGTLSPGRSEPADPSTEPLSGKLREGLTAIATSPQLRRICLYLATYTFGSTILYYVKGDMIQEAFDGRLARTKFYADLNLYVGIGSLIPQLFLTSRAMRVLGLAGTLTILPIVSAIGFALLWFAPSFTLLVIFETARRALNFIFAKPAREVLFTGVTTRQRFQAKPIIDTAWYRGTDWLESELLSALQWTPAATALLGVPIALAGGLLGRSLGKAHEDQRAEGADPDSPSRPKTP